MFGRLTRVLVVATLFVSMDAHLAVLQTTAWVKMAVTFCHRDTLAVSVEKTFDGRHLCPMCMKVRSAAQQGPSLGANHTPPKPDRWMPFQQAQPVRTDSSWNLFAFLSSVPSAFISADTPPPIPLPA